MNAKKKINIETGNAVSGDPWEDLVSRVLERFDPEDISHRWAIESWKKAADSKRNSPVLGKIIHEFKSPDLLKSVMAFFVADIEENIAIFKAKLAGQRCKTAREQVIADLSAYDGFFPGDDDEVVVERLAVIGQIEEALDDRNLNLIDLSRTLAGSDGDLEELAISTTFPGKDENIQAYLTDLAKFINSNGDYGRNLIEKVCTDKETARKVDGHKDMPKPVKFLATLALKYKFQNSEALTLLNPLGFSKNVEIS